MTTSEEWAERFAGYVPPEEPLRGPSATEQLRRQTAAAVALLATYDDILGDDAEVRRTAVEGETDLHEAIRAGLARIVEIGALQESITATAGRLIQRAGRLSEQEKRIRTAMLTAMEVGGLPKLETALGTVSQRRVPPSLVITDETKIPENFWDPQPPKLNKSILKGALAAGVQVPGAELSNGGQTLAVRLS